MATAPFLVTTAPSWVQPVELVRLAVTSVRYQKVTLVFLAAVSMSIVARTWSRSPLATGRATVEFTVCAPPTARANPTRSCLVVPLSMSS